MWRREYSDEGAVVTSGQQYGLETRILVPTISLFVEELTWLVSGLRTATDRFRQTENTSDFRNLMSWRRLAFRLTLAEIEALAMSYRDIGWFKHVTQSSPRGQCPRELNDDAQWRRINVESRYQLSMDGLAASYAIPYDATQRSRLSGWLASSRVVRRQLAHPKVPPDLVPEDRSVEELRRVMVLISGDLGSIAEAVIPAEQRPWASIQSDIKPFGSLRKFLLRRLGEEWDESFYGRVAEDPDATYRLSVVMLGELARDSSWAQGMARALLKNRHKTQSRPNPIATRIVIATYFGEIEGTCAIVSRSAIYAHGRGELDLPDAKVQWLQCVAGMKPAKELDESLRSKLDLVTQIEWCFRVLAEMRSADRDVSINERERIILRKSVDLRDRLYHPRKLGDLVPDHDDYQVLLQSVRWFYRVRNQFFREVDGAP